MSGKELWELYVKLQHEMVDRPSGRWDDWDHVDPPYRAIWDLLAITATAAATMP